VNDILVNGPNQVYVERQGKLYLTDVRFNDSSSMDRASGVTRLIPFRRLMLIR